TFPSIAIAANTVQGQMFDLSDTIITLAATVGDPDGDPIVSTLWTESCAAVLASDPTSLNAVLIPVMFEVCTVTQTTCDSRGCNQAETTFDINCTTLGSTMDPSAPGAIPINDCFLNKMCDPADPLAPNFPGDCIANSWECGTGMNACNESVVCGVCDAPPIPDVNNGYECNPGTQMCDECAYDLAAACAGQECGDTSVTDDCGNVLTVTCPNTCVAPYNCVVDTCVTTVIWTGPATQMGSTACLDMLMGDGWNAVDAQAFQLELSSEDTTVTVTEAADQSGACITVDPQDKRCASNEFLPGLGGCPAMAGARPFYMYVAAFFPD
ncbi:MAG: hypothetical protein GY851_03165, partial [bacterium]|nr:hypothetical protein [bacterium]